MLSVASIALALSAAGLASAHGNLVEWTIGSTTVPAYNPYQDPYMSPIPDRSMRTIPGNGPVEQLDLVDIRCNQNAQPGKLVDTVTAGETLGLKWTEWPESHAGPVLTYLARVPEGKDVTTWDASDAEWFKIQEGGYDATKGWAATTQLYAANSVVDVTIPAQLKAGQYLLRHEIIALHAAFSYPGAQAYPACIQLEVTGSGSALPTKGLVSFPGAYGADTPGIKFDIYQTDLSTYPIPGPALWDGVSDTIGDGSSSPAPTASTSPAPAPTTSAAETSVPATSAAATTAAPKPTTSAAEEPAPTSSAAEEPAPTTSAAEEPLPTTSAAEEPVPTTSAAEEPAPTTSAAEEPVPTTSAAEEPVPTTSAAEEPVPTTSAAEAPVPTTAAPVPTSAPGTGDANKCWRDYNTCLDKSQPKPDFTGCSTTRDQCLTTARYQRLRRSATIGRRF